MGNAVQASTAAQTQAINTEIGGFISSPAISPRTIKANRNNHSFISFTAVLSHSSFWNTFFSHHAQSHQVQEQVIACKRTDMQTPTKRIRCLTLTRKWSFVRLVENHLLMGIWIFKMIYFHPNQHNCSTHQPQSLGIHTSFFRKQKKFFNQNFFPHRFFNIVLPQMLFSIVAAVHLR